MELIIYLKMDLALNSLQRLICHKTKPIILEEQKCYYLTHVVHTFPKGICPKVNIIAFLELELVYYDSAVYRFNPYTSRISPSEFFSVLEDCFEMSANH